jgi:biotin transport system substrate-specific component
MDQLPKRSVLATSGGGTVASQPLVLSDLIPGALARDLLLVVSGAGLVGLLAQISIHIPGTPVPITGQTLGVLLTGTALGWRRGVAAMLLYAVVGVIGLPWFAGGTSGYAGASFGYIIGFIFAAGVCGRLAEMGNDRKLRTSVPAMVAGEIIMYVIGVAWLAVDLHVGVGTAISEGFTPFWIGDAIKCALAAGLLPSAWKLANVRPRD